MKGNVIVGQSGGPTAVINASLAGIYKTAKDLGANKVYGMVHGVQGLIKEDYIDLDDYIKTDLDVELLKRTPSAFLGSCRYKLPEASADKELFDHIFAILDKMNIEAFFYIGGNDSMDTINKLANYAAKIGHPTRFVGCPKTIDNDLAITDHTPGYGSAAKYVGTSVKEIIRDSTCLDFPKGMVTIVEIMGRNAGWLAGAAVLAEAEDCAGPDLIYLPEVPFNLDDFCAKVKELLTQKSSVIVAISEGILLADGRYVCELGADTGFVDSFGHKQLTGTASFLAGYIGGELGCKTRTVEFSNAQRAASHIASLTDVNEAFQAGAAAVRAADAGETAKMVIFTRISEAPYLCGTELRDVDKIANDEKLVPREWITEDGTYVTQEFVDYLRPLIQGELPPIMVDGIPRHLYRKL